MALAESAAPWSPNAIIDGDDPPGLACLPPVRTEVLDAMSDPTPNDVTLGEVYRAIAGLRGEIKEDVEELRASLAQVVSKEVFQAEVARLEAELQRAEEKARMARTIALWGLGVMLSAVGAAVVAIVVAINT